MNVGQRRSSVFSSSSCSERESFFWGGAGQWHRFLRVRYSSCHVTIEMCLRGSGTPVLLFPLTCQHNTIRCDSIIWSVGFDGCRLFAVTESATRRQWLPRLTPQWTPPTCCRPTTIAVCWRLRCLSFLAPRRGTVFTGVCLSVCLFIHTISQKPLHIGSPNLTLKCSTMIPGNLFILGSKGQRSKVKVTRHRKALLVFASFVSVGF